jgi:hypothetical protein
LEEDFEHATAKTPSDTLSPSATTAAEATKRTDNV